MSGVKMSKASILRKTAAYVEELFEQNTRLLCQNRQLRASLQLESNAITGTVQAASITSALLLPVVPSVSPAPLLDDSDGMPCLTPISADFFMSTPISPANEQACSDREHLSQECAFSLKIATLLQDYASECHKRRSKMQASGDSITRVLLCQPSMLSLLHAPERAIATTDYAAEVLHSTKVRQAARRHGTNCKVDNLPPPQVRQEQTSATEPSMDGNDFLRLGAHCSSDFIDPLAFGFGAATAHRPQRFAAVAGLSQAVLMSGSLRTRNSRTEGCSQRAENETVYAPCDGRRTRSIEAIAACYGGNDVSDPSQERERFQQFNESDLSLHFRVPLALTTSCSNISTNSSLLDQESDVTNIGGDPFLYS